MSAHAVVCPSLFRVPPIRILPFCFPLIHHKALLWGYEIKSDRRNYLRARTWLCRRIHVTSVCARFVCSCFFHEICNRCILEFGVDLRVAQPKHWRQQFCFFLYYYFYHLASFSFFKWRSFQESASGCWMLSGLLFGHAITIDANHFRCYDWRRRIDHAEHRVSKCQCKRFAVAELELMFISFWCFRFVQSWRVKNNSDEVWPYGCYIKCTSNENLPTTPVSPVEPGQCTVVSVKLRSPAEFGSFQTKWRLFTSNGSCFGGKLRIGLRIGKTFWNHPFFTSQNRYDVVDSSSYRNWYFSVNTTIIRTEDEQYEWCSGCTKANIWGMFSAILSTLTQITTYSSSNGCWAVKGEYLAHSNASVLR